MVPHFYSPFYVFPDAHVAQSVHHHRAESARGRALAGTEGHAAVPQRFSARGSRKYPIELLKDAGVDMTTDEPLDLTMREMNRVMDEMERLLPAR